MIQDVIEDAEMIAEGDEMPEEYRVVPNALQRAAASMETELRQMRVSLEAQHLPRQQHGQIDPKRFLTRQPWEIDFFRSYDPGCLEETDVEAVILVDQSLSMASRMNDVSAALWATKKALEEIDARVTVIGFADRHYVLYQPTEKVKRKELRRFPIRGGTVPLGALSMAYRMLSASRRKIKIMITLTDGDWLGEREKQDTLVKAINGLDVVTSLMFIGSANADKSAKVDERHRHNHQITTRISDPSDLTKNAVQMVEAAMARNVHFVD